MVVMGDVAAVGVLFWGLLVEDGEGDGGDDDFDAMALLGLKLCCGSTAQGYRSQLCCWGRSGGCLLAAGDGQLNFWLATGGRAACPWIWRAFPQGNPRLGLVGWVYRAGFLFSTVLLGETWQVLQMLG